MQIKTKAIPANFPVTTLLSYTSDPLRKRRTFLDGKTPSSYLDTIRH